MNAQGHRIVFLYSELAGYFLACAEALGQHSDVDSVDIVHWPVHPEAPFQYSSTAHFTLHPKENHDRPSLKHLLKRINPTAIVCWMMDADYVPCQDGQAHPAVSPSTIGGQEALNRGFATCTAHPTIVQPGMGSWRTTNSVCPKAWLSGHALATTYCQPQLS